MSWYGKLISMVLAVVAVGGQIGTGSAQTPSPTSSGREIFSLTAAGAPAAGLPATVRLLNGSVTVATKDGAQMLKASTPSEFLITLPEALPQDFTLVFDLVPKECCNPEDLGVEGTATMSRSSSSAQILWHTSTQHVAGGGADYQAATPAEIRETSPGQLTSIVITFEGETVKLYTNGRRLYTLTGRRFVRGRVLRVFLGGANEGDQAVYLARLRILAGVVPPSATVASRASDGALRAGPLVSGTATSTGGSTPNAVTALPAASPTGTITPMTPPPPPASELGRAPAGAPTVLSNGPAPTGLAITGSPGLASLTWAGVPGAIGYRVKRAPLGSTNWTLLTPTAIEVTQLTSDVVPDPMATYTYQVVAYQSDGRYGSASADFRPPPPTDPSGFSGRLVAPAGVQLTWNAVPGVTEYVVSGPGIGADARTTATAFAVAIAPPGLNAYRVASVFPPGKVLTAVVAWPSVTLKVPPVPSIAFLTLPNGKGSLAEYNRHACVAGKWLATQFLGLNDWCDLPGTHSIANVRLFPIVSLFGVRYWVSDNPNGVAPDEWVMFSQSRWILAGDGEADVETQFNDYEMLGKDRIVGCARRGADVTMCWGVSKDRNPESPGELERRGPLNIIIQEPGGMYFLSFVDQRDPSSPSGWRMAPAPTASLDSQGERFLPHACLACHGGRYDAQTGRVIGATLLPIERRFSRGGSYPFASIDRMNILLYGTALAPGVREYVTRMYGGIPTMEIKPLTGDDMTAALQAARDAAPVPVGWSSQPQVYRTVYRPYCSSCHMSQSGPLQFKSWTDMELEKVRIKQAICTGRMPHAEVAFRRFWEDGGLVSLPGLLLAALGYSGC